MTLNTWTDPAYRMPNLKKGRQALSLFLQHTFYSQTFLKESPIEGVINYQLVANAFQTGDTNFVREDA